MKKVFIIFTVSVFFYLVSHSMAGQNTAPPLLIQQPTVQSAVPGIPPGPPAPELPVAPPPGPGIGQTIPAQTLLNNVSTAATTVQKIMNLLTAGKVWIKKGRAGEIEIKGGVLYQGSVVAVLNFNPVDCSVLPLGIHTSIHQNTYQIQTVKARLTTVIHELKILPAAEFREPEASWVFPVALGNRIVAHLKVYYNGIHIVPDYPANQEMTYYGQ